jgi:membrane protease YdiL (CAAX protease family)
MNIGLGQEPTGGAGVKLNRRRSVPVELVASAALLGWGAAVSRLIPAPAYVPANLAVAGLSLAAARRRQVPVADMGLSRDRIAAGLRVGLAASAPVAAVVFLGASLPATRRWFLDERARTGGAGHLLYHTLVRIPLGTAVAEEATFRGSLLGLLLQRHSRVRATAVSSVLFGCWHVLPTLDTLALNPVGAVVGDDLVRTGGALLASVLVTTVAGVGFSWLRFHSDSVVAPMVVHAALNSSALLAARLVAPRASRSRHPRDA